MKPSKLLLVVPIMGVLAGCHGDPPVPEDKAFFNGMAQEAAKEKSSGPKVKGGVHKLSDMNAKPESPAGQPAATAGTTGN